MCQDKIYEKLIPLLGAISPEGLGFAHLANGLMPRIDDRRWQGLGYVTDAEADYFNSRVCIGKSLNTTCYFRKKVASFQLQVVFIYQRHTHSSLVQILSNGAQ